MGRGKATKPKVVEKQGILGLLEIDYFRGVIYFHAHDKEFIERFGGETVLRIQGLAIQHPLEGMIDLYSHQKSITDQFVTNDPITAADKDPDWEESE